MSDAIDRSRKFSIETISRLFCIPTHIVMMQAGLQLAYEEYKNLCRHIDLDESAAERILKEEADGHGLEVGIKRAKIRVIREALS